MAKRLEIANTRQQRSVYKAGLAVRLSVFFCITSFMGSAAFAQTSPQPSTLPQNNTDIPMSANVDVRVQDESVLPQNLQPEKISAPIAQMINPNIKGRDLALGKNQWNSRTLTQSTGLSAASYQPWQDVSKPSPSDVRPREQTPYTNGTALESLTAEDLLNIGDIRSTGERENTALDANSNGIGVTPSMRGALFDLPTYDNTNESVFKLDMGQRLCLGTAEECRTNETRRIDVGYAPTLTRGKMNGFNLQLTPRAGIQFNEESKSALVGAIVRIGDNLREGSEMKSNTWYFFAGADAEAVTYTPNSIRRLTKGAFHLQNRIIVGDAQAGFGYRLGSADLALTYFKRNARAENYSYNEDAAALSITWKR